MLRRKENKANAAKHRSSLELLEHRKAPLAATHRRGGTHRVRDQDKTNSIYDSCNYRDLLDAAKERGVYRKDMKKVEMAWALKRNDEEKRRAERLHLHTLRKKQQEEKRERDRLAAEREEFLKAKHQKKAEKRMKRERDESVSDDTLSEAEVEAEQEARDEYNREVIGQALSESSWDSTSTESITDSTDQAVKPSCKLQLLEWPYQTMPPVDHSSSPLPSLDAQPRQIPYAPLKITTTLSKQKFCLPGHKYPPSVDPDFVPVVPASVRTAAQKGRLEGILRNALLETGEEWASRTLVQGSSATLYFHPGNVNDPTKSLAGVYDKWNAERRRLKRVKTKSEAKPGAREERKRQRKRIKSRMVAEVYEACRWRPVAVGYVPAYLNFGDRAGENTEKERSLANLRFVRFKECDVPHYYFWIRDEEGIHEESVEVGRVRQHAMVGARKRPCKNDTVVVDHETGSRTSTNNEVENILETRSAASAEALFHNTSAAFVPSQDTDRHQSVAEWLDQISSSGNAAPTLASSSKLLDTAGPDDRH